MDNLLVVGGSKWFVDALFRQLVKYEHSMDLNRAVGLIFGLFHLDVEECTFALLTHVLPNYLLNEHKQELLFEPKASALARLTVMTIYSALNELKNRRSGRKRHYLQDTAGDFEPMDIDSKAPHGGGDSGNQRPPKVLRRSDSQSGLIGLLDDTPFAFQERHQFSSEETPRKSVAHLNEPFTKAIADLLRLLTIIISDSSVSQRVLFPLVFLEQLVLCVKSDAQDILQFMPLPMIMSLIEIMPETISYEFLLAVGNIQTLKSRKVVARALCQLSRAKKGATKCSLVL
jgi:mediator of RNA polymerase II transcription subunit 24